MQTLRWRIPSSRSLCHHPHLRGLRTSRAANFAALEPDGDLSLVLGNQPRVACILKESSPLSGGIPEPQIGCNRWQRLRRAHARRNESQQSLPPLLLLRDAQRKAWLYLFGTAAIRLQRNDFRDTLILKADSSNAAPSDPNVALIPLRQPNKDFYRIGVGINFTNLLDSIKKK